LIIDIGPVVAVVIVFRHRINAGLTTDGVKGRSGALPARRARRSAAYFVPLGLIPQSQATKVIHMVGFVRRVPQGDYRDRMVCADCGYIAYENPKVVIGSVVVVEGAVLMCRRAIEPRLGYWTLPAGYLELGETVEEGAMREALEEAQADIALDGILAVFSIARIDQVQVIFRARFAGAPRFAPGPESLEVSLFPWDRIPWDEIAFPSVRWSLDAWRQAGAGPLGAPFGNPPDDRRGSRRIAGVVRPDG
jgi:ADP-ribose pyrophosphatase YjhB (NUDIX family)